MKPDEREALERKRKFFPLHDEGGKADHEKGEAETISELIGGMRRPKKKPEKDDHEMSAEKWFEGMPMRTPDESMATWRSNSIAYVERILAAGRKQGEAIGSMLLNHQMGAWGEVALAGLVNAAPGERYRAGRADERREIVKHLREAAASRGDDVEAQLILEVVADEIEKRGKP
jgi:hypothetical protein